MRKKRTKSPNHPKATLPKRKKRVSADIVRPQASSSSVSVIDADPAAHYYAPGDRISIGEARQDRSPSDMPYDRVLFQSDAAILACSVSNGTTGIGSRPIW
jgi:hypothetical protein